MLQAVTPVLEQQLKKPLKKLAGQKRSLDQAEDGQSMSEGEDMSQSDEDEDDFDDDPGILEDGEGDEDDDDSESESETGSINGDSEESDTQIKPQEQPQHIRKPKRAKSNRTPKKLSSVNLTIGVPGTTETTTAGKVVGLEDSISSFSAKKPDVINSTILNSSESIFLGDTPFFFCTTAGIKWIADKTGEDSMVDRFQKSFRTHHDANFTLYRQTVEQCNAPTEISAALLEPTSNVFKRCLSSLDFMSAEEVDTLVNNELSPEDGNGFAEKLTVHAIIAMGLICMQDCPELLDLLPVKVDMAFVHLHINSAFYYFFRFSLIGNSLIGVKGVVLLIICLLFTSSHAPPLMVSSAAVRLAQEVGLHLKQCTVGLPRIEAERRSRLWWTIYYLEKDVSIRFGKPSNIVDESITTPLPTYTPELDIGFEKEKFCYARTITQLYLIWSKLSVTIYRIPSSRITVKEKLANLIQYDKELMAWREALPPFFRPGYTGDPLASLSHLSANQMWRLRFSIIFSHTMFYYVQLSIHRQVAYHPSWIYKVTSSEKPTNESGKPSPPSNKTSPSQDSDTDNTSMRNQNAAIGNYIATKYGHEANGNVNAQSHMSYVEHQNNVKLITKRVATEYPRLLRSFQISVECSRQTILAIHNTRGSSVASFSLSFFLLNAFITLLIKCFMQPHDPETPKDLQVMWLTIEWVERLSFFTSQLLPANTESFLHVLMDVINRYVEKKRSTKLVLKTESVSPSEALGLSEPRPIPSCFHSNGVAAASATPATTAPTTGTAAAAAATAAPAAPPSATGTTAGAAPPVMPAYPQRPVVSAYASQTGVPTATTTGIPEFPSLPTPASATAPVMPNGTNGGIPSFSYDGSRSSPSTAPTSASQQQQQQFFHNAVDSAVTAAAMVAASSTPGPSAMANGSASSTSSSGVPGLGAFDDYFFDPIMAGDPQIFDSLYQLSSHWGSWESTDQWAI